MKDACMGLTALVTGASRGIGAGIARRFAAEGARVAVLARSLAAGDSRIEGSLEETTEAIRSAGGTAIAVVADLADSGVDRGELVTQVENQLGPIDILVNNAAAYLDAPFEQLTEKRFRIAVELNWRAPLDLAQRVVPGMRERGRGWILNISSAAGLPPTRPPSAGTSGPLLYASTKAALDRASSALAEELYPHHIAVNSLSPQAAVRTAATAMYYVGLSEDAYEPVETMAEAALALCTGEPQTVTGRVVRSLELLVELERPVFGLEGEHLVDGWQPEQIPTARPGAQGNRGPTVA
jgi:NAD(P)-dependent dehydrogenase (short-subunit alcohol dehydrogenase family)